MNYTDFKKSIDGGVCREIYLFEGEDAFFSNRGLLLLKDKFLSEPDLNLKVFSDTVTASELIASLESYPFMSPKRLTVVKEFYPDKNFIKGDFKAYLENPYPTSILIIQNLKPCDALKKFSSVCTVDCSKADTSLLIKWIRVEGQRNGVEFDMDSCSALAEYCLRDMTRINTETQKLISYGLKTGKITKADVDELVTKDTEYKIFELTDFLGARKFSKALDVIHELLGKGETYQRLIISLYNYFRKLLHVSISDKSNKELATILSTPDFVVAKLKKQASFFKKKSIKNAVDMLSDADYKIKSGLTDDQTAMWLTLFKIMTN